MEDDDGAADAVAAPAVPPAGGNPPGEKFTLRGRLERGSATGTGATGLVIHGPWRDVTGAIGAQARYMLEQLGDFDVERMAVPPDGTFPGRMNFGGAAATAKRSQMVDRMSLRFTQDGDDCTCEGDGANRVGGYVLRGTLKRSGAGWDVELQRTYTSGPPQAVPPPTKKRSTSNVDLAASERPARAAAPPKGAWGAQPKAEALSPKTSRPEVARKCVAAASRPCVAAIFGSRGGVSTVHRTASLAEAERHCAGLAQEAECAIRAASADSDGVLFPVGSDSSSGDASTPPHVIVLDVSAPNDAKQRPWRATLAGFSSARRAATYALHAYRTCGPRLQALEWHAFSNSSQAEARMMFNGEGIFDPSLPVADLAALDQLAALKY
ncbi:hypothetical protein M885DRAFT_505308 [Pelagophyceae sp. CCMP2097]|nr:hypothetical protein M885DRAFT_505308 [Pelagophyceae sp. CCMP2097]